MSLFLIFSNLHVGVNLLLALAWLMLAWLAFDSFSIKRNAQTASNFAGFSLLAVWQIINAFTPTNDLTLYLAYGVYLLGLLLILVSHLMEKPVIVNGLAAVLVSVSFASLAPMAQSLAVILLGAIAFVNYRHYRQQQNKSLRPYWLGFAALTIGAILSWGTEQALGGGPLFSHLIGHLFELVGAGLLAWWVWQFLAFRLREEITLIFISLALLIAIVVTLAFSTITVTQVENAALADLETNARVLNLSIQDGQAELLARIKSLVNEPVIGRLTADKQFGELAAALNQALKDEKLDFLKVSDAGGEVLVAAPIAAANESVRSQVAPGQALGGQSAVTVEEIAPGVLAIQAAAPLAVGGRAIGVLSGGRLLDNAFVDGIKKITGLESSIYNGRERVASTEFNLDGRTRATGFEETNSTVLETVLGNKQPLTLRTAIASRPYLASYLPLANSRGESVGMLLAAKSQLAILQLATRTTRFTLLIVSIIVLILILPVYFIAKRLSQTG